jgi:hypothetical protein
MAAAVTGEMCDVSNIDVFIPHNFNHVSGVTQTRRPFDGQDINAVAYKHFPTAL